MLEHQSGVTQHNGQSVITHARSWDTQLGHPRVFGAPPVPEGVAMGLARGYLDTFTNFRRSENNIRSSILQSEEGKPLWSNLRNHETPGPPPAGYGG